MSPTYNGFDITNSTVDVFGSDFIILQKKAPEIGDVILFHAPTDGHLYFHRVIAISEAHGTFSYLTKGDGNRYTDNSKIGETLFGWIPQSNVLGVAVFTIHNIGWFINNLFSINALLPIIGIIMLVGLFYYLEHDNIKKSLVKFINKKPKELKFNFYNRIIDLNRNTLKKLLILGLLVIILIIPILGEVSDSILIHPNVQLQQTNGEPLSSFIDITNPHLFDLEYYTYNGQTVDFLNIKVKITSAGFFNSIETVKIQVLGQNNSINMLNENYFYRWTSTYFFAGTKIINGDLMIPYNLYSRMGNTSLQIQINYTLSHVLTQEHIIKNQILIIGEVA